MDKNPYLNFYQKVQILNQLLEEHKPATPGSIHQSSAAQMGKTTYQRPIHHNHEKTLSEDYHRAKENGAVFDKYTTFHGPFYERKGKFYVPRSLPLNFPIWKDGRFTAAALTHFSKACAKCNEPSHLVGQDGCAYAHLPMTKNPCSRCEGRGLHSPENCLATA